MAASETVRLRLQFDYPPPATPHCTAFWLLVDLNRCRVVTDLISLIRQRFGFSSGALLGLYLEGGLLPPTESARLVRDNDCLRCARAGWGGGPPETGVRGGRRGDGVGMSNCTEVNLGDSDWSSRLWSSGIYTGASIWYQNASDAGGWWTKGGKTQILCEQGPCLFELWFSKCSLSQALQGQVQETQANRGLSCFFHKGAAFLTVLLQYFLGLLVGVILCFTWAFCGSLK